MSHPNLSPYPPTYGYGQVHQSNKSFLVTWLLSLLLGVLGVDRFYLGKVGTGILKLLTFGGLGIWALIDLILVVTNKIRDKQGLPLEGYDRHKKLALIVTGSFILLNIIFTATRGGSGTTPTSAVSAPSTSASAAATASATPTKDPAVAAAEADAAAKAKADSDAATKAKTEADAAAKEKADTDTATKAKTEADAAAKAQADADADAAAAKAAAEAEAAAKRGETAAAVLQVAVSTLHAEFEKGTTLTGGPRVDWWTGNGTDVFPVRVVTVSMKAFSDADQNFTADNEPASITAWRDTMGVIPGDVQNWYNSDKGQGYDPALRAKVEADFTAADQLVADVRASK